MLLDLEIGMERGVNEIGMGGGFRFGGIKRDLIGVDTMYLWSWVYLNLIPRNRRRNVLLVFFVLFSTGLCLKTWLV